MGHNFLLHFSYLSIMILFQKKPLVNIDIRNRKFSSFIAKVDFTICILDMHMCSICICIVFMYSNLLSWIYHLCICKEKINSSYHDVGVSGCCTGTKAGGTELRTSTRLHRAQGGSPSTVGKKYKIPGSAVRHPHRLSGKTNGQTYDSNRTWAGWS